MSEKPPALRVTELEVRYHGGSEPAVAGVSLSIAAGESLCIDGGEGAGKSSVLRAVLGLTPYGGEVAIDGGRPTSAARRRMSYGPQAPDFAGGMTARQVMGLVAGLRGLDPEAITSACLRLAALPEERWDIPVGPDSATSRRLALALAAAGEPLVAVIDDPPNDPASEAVVRHLRERGAAVLVAVAEPWPELLTALGGPVMKLAEGTPE